MTGGVIQIPNLVVHDLTVVRLHFLGRVTEYELRPAEPRLVARASPDAVKVYGLVKLKAWFEDDEGVIPAGVTVTYALSGDCGERAWRVPAGTEITYWAAQPGTCVFKASYSNSLFALEGVAAFRVEAPLVTESSLDVAKLSDWDYDIRARVSTDVPVSGTLQLYVDGNLVAADSGHRSWWEASYSLRGARPGVHTVRMVFSGEFGLYYEEERVLEVPKRPYTMPLEDYYVVPFGVDVVDYLVSLAGGGVRVAVSYVNKTHAVAVVYYPGDEVHLPALKMVAVEIAYPELIIAERNDIRAIIVAVRNGQPGANVTAYCVRGAETMILYQATLRGPGLVEVLGDFDCDYAYMRYRYGVGELVVVDNQPEPVLHTSSCLAGVPCVPVAPSKFIKAVYIGGESYTPGNPLRLKEGVYQVRVVQTDGTEVRFPLVVVGLGPVEVLYNPSDRRLVWVPITPAPIKLVLADGRVLEVEGRGSWIQLPAPIVNAYSDWFEVRLAPLHVITG